MLSAKQYGLKRIALSGVSWTAVGVLIHGAGQLVVLSVLARHISPTEFGVANSALLVFALGSNVFESAAGLNIAQRKKLSSADICSAAQVSLLLALVLSGLLWATRDFVVAFFGTDELVPALRVIGWTILLGGLVGAKEAVLFHQRRYKTVTIITTFSFVFGYAPLGIWLALHGAGFMAIVYAHLGMYATKVVLLFGFVKNPAFSYVGLKCLTNHLTSTVAFSFGRFATFAANNVDKIVVARVIGMEGLGYYGRAHQIMMIPNKVFMQGVAKVLTPLFASIQDEQIRLRKAFLRSIELFLVAISPAVVLAVAFKEEIVFLLLGPGWDIAANLLAVLAIAGAFHVLYKVPLLVLHAQMLSVQTALSQNLFIAILLPAVIVASFWGVEAVAIAVSVATAINYILLTGQLARRLRLDVSEVARAHVRGFRPTIPVVALTVALPYSLTINGYIEFSITAIFALGVAIFACRRLLK